MIFILIVGMFLGFEIQKLFQFNFFFRLRCLVSDYYNNIILRKESPIHREVIKVGLVDFIYYVVIFIGFFTMNKFFFISMIALSIISSTLFRTFKNKTFRKIIFILDSIISIAILCLFLTNSLFYHTNSLDFLKILISKF